MPLSPPGPVCRQKKGDVRKKRRRPRKVVCCHKKGTWERRKEKDQGRREGGSHKARFRVPSTKNFFFGSRVFGFWETHLDWSIGSCVIFIQGSHVRRKFRKRTTLRSKSSTLKGLLYAPIKREQYHKRTTLRRLKIPLRIIVARNATLSPWSKSWANKLSSDKRQSTFIHELEIPRWFHTWAVPRSLANARKCQLEDFCEKERYESCSIQRTFTADAFRKVRKGENVPVVLLLLGSHERLAFKKLTRSVPEHGGACTMY